MSRLEFQIESCTFEAIRLQWATELWPGRISAIEPCSAMKWLGGIDMELMKSPPSFWRVVHSPDMSGHADSVLEYTVGVLSGHFGGIIDGTRAYRTRGLWVSPQSRGRGAARLLMNAAFKQARAEKCTTVWTFPRESSMRFYESFGFQRVGEWIGKDDPRAGEFGPNCYAIAKL